MQGDLPHPDSLAFPGGTAEPLNALPAARGASGCRSLRPRRKCLTRGNAPLEGGAPGSAGRWLCGSLPPGSVLPHAETCTPGGRIFPDQALGESKLNSTFSEGEELICRPSSFSGEKDRPRKLWDTAHCVLLCPPATGIILPRDPPGRPLGQCFSDGGGAAYSSPGRKPCRLGNLDRIWGCQIPSTWLGALTHLSWCSIKTHIF